MEDAHGSRETQPGDYSMIELRKITERTEHQPAKYGVFIDESLVDGVEVNTLGIDDLGVFALITTTQAATNQLLTYSFSEFTRTRYELSPVSLLSVME